MGSKNKSKNTDKTENNNINTSVQTPASENQTLLDSESKKLDSLPPKQNPIFKTDTEKLFEKVKAKVEAIKASRATDACNIPCHDISASTSEKGYPLEKKIESGEPDNLRDLPNVSQRAEATADTGSLLVCDRVQELVNTEKKKKMKKKEKKTTTDIKIQTLLKQLDNISSIVRCCPTCFDPVKESLLQVLPEYKVPEPVLNSGSNPKISKRENDNSTVLKPKKEKMKKKTTNTKIQTLLEQSDNTTPIVGCGPASFDPVKESFAQELPECDQATFDPVKESLVQELPECKVTEPVLNSGSNPKIPKRENDNSTVLKPKKKKMKKTTTNTKIQTLLEQSDNTTPIVGSGPASFDPAKESFSQELPVWDQATFDPVKKSLVQELPECEVLESVLNSGSNPKISKRENDDSTVLKPKKKKMKKKTTNTKIQTLLEQSDNTTPIVGSGPASFYPVKESLVQKLSECGPASFDPVKESFSQELPVCDQATFDPVKESLVEELPECEVPEPVLNSGSNLEISKHEKDSSTVLKSKKKKMKEKTTNTKIQTLLELSGNTSPIVGCVPASFDPVKESVVQELPECGPASFDPVKESLSQELPDCDPATFNPVKESVVQELPECEVPEPVLNSGLNPKNFKYENDNSNVLKPKKKIKKKTTNTKIQTLLEHPDNTSPIVGCGPSSSDPVKESFVQELPECGPASLDPVNESLVQVLPVCDPASFDPVKESVVQDLPECKVPEPVVNSGSNPKIFKYENDNSTVLKPKKKKMKKKTTNMKIQTLLEQSDNTSHIVGCGQASFDPVKESLNQKLPKCSLASSDPIKESLVHELLECDSASFVPVKESLVQELRECEVIYELKAGGVDERRLVGTKLEKLAEGDTASLAKKIKTTPKDSQPSSPSIDRPLSTNHESESGLERPIGRKAAKKMKRAAYEATDGESLELLKSMQKDALATASSRSDSINRSLQLQQEMMLMQKEEQERQKEIVELQKEELKLRLAKEDRERQKEERERHVYEASIMAMDTTAMAPDQAKYYNALKARIMRNIL